MNGPLRTFTLTLLLFAALLSTAGAQWRQVPRSVLTAAGSPSGSFFNEVFFYDNNYGWVTEGGTTVLYTTNGGSTWNSSTLTSGSFSYNRDICFVSQTTGYICGSDGVWRTTNSGGSWTNISPTRGQGSGSALWFVDANNGVLARGTGTQGATGDTALFFRTTDGGSTWLGPVVDSLLSDAVIGGVSYGSGTYYVSGSNSYFWRSTDNGASWTRHTTGSGGWQEDLISAGGKQFIASATGTSSSTTGTGKILVSTTNDTTWSTTNFSQIMWGVTMVSSSVGWACGEQSAAYQTTDGGATWTSRNCGIPPGVHLDDIYFTDATHGWAVGPEIFQYVPGYFEADPDTIDFGTVQVGVTSPTRYAPVRAIGGGGTLTRSMSGPDVADFTAIGGLGSISLSYCAGDSTPVRFTPTKEGLEVAYLHYIPSNGDTQTVVLLGRGVRPQIRTTPELLLDTIVCSNTIIDTIDVENRGGFPLTITDTSFSSASGRRYTVLSPAVPFDILPGGLTKWAIRLVADVPGPFVDTLLLISNDPSSPARIPIRGFRQVVGVSLNPDTLVTLAGVRVGFDSSVCVLYRNTGNAAQVITEVAPVSGSPSIEQTPSAGGRRVLPTGPPSGAPPEAICFTINAQDTGWVTRRFRVRTAPCDRDTFITVRAYAISPIVASETLRRLAPVACSDGVADTVYIHNHGNADLILGQPTVGGTSAGEFSVTTPGTWPQRISPGDSLAVILEFTPGVGIGQRTATLSFPTNDGFPGKAPWVIDIEASREKSAIAVDTARVVDLKDVCINDIRTATFVITNSGTVVSRLERLIPDVTSTAVSILRDPSGRDLAPSESDSIRFDVIPQTVGPFEARYSISYGPCSATEQIIVRGNAIDADLVITGSFNLGNVPVGRATTHTVTLRNNGQTPLTVSLPVFDPPVPGLSISSPDLPAVLAAGETRVVTITILPTAPGAVTSIFVVENNGRCGTQLRRQLTATATDGSLLTDRSRVDYGSTTACADTEILDSVMVTWIGDDPVAIGSVALVGSGTSFSIVSAPSTLVPEQPEPIRLLARSSTGGDVYDTLLIEPDDASEPSIRIPLHARFELPRLEVLDSLEAPLMAITFDVLECDQGAVRKILLRNSGTLRDTVTIQTALAGVMLSTSAPVILAPGVDSTITLELDADAFADGDGTLRIHRMPCDQTQEIPIAIRIEKLPTAADDIDLGRHLVGTSAPGAVAVTNNSSHDRTISRVWIDDPSGTISVLGSYAGTPLPAGATQSITVSFAPDRVVSADAELHVELTGGCTDTVAARVQAQGVDELAESYELTAGIPELTGRWGQRVSVPVGLVTRDSTPLGSFELRVSAAGTLLDPVSVTPVLAGWNAEIVSFNPVDGVCRIRVTPPPASVVTAGIDTLLRIEYDVLRGPEITTSIEPEITGLADNYVVSRSPGRFSLADYCDAHGRLLSVSGALRLEQNVPNPATDGTMIEFEVPFDADVVLSVFDASGVEVIRLVDGYMPAGRSRVQITSHDLPSGSYTYRLRVGLQSLTRRLVITR